MASEKHGNETLAARWAVGLDWEFAWLFGVLVVVTGPTVIVPMLRTVRPNARVAEVLRWEGTLIDPIGALLAVLVYQFLAARGAELTPMMAGPVRRTFNVFQTRIHSCPGRRHSCNTDHG